MASFESTAQETEIDTKNKFCISDDQFDKKQIRHVFKAGKFHHGLLPYVWSTIFTPQRVFVLRKGRICNVYSGITSGNDIVVDAVKRENDQNNKVFYLGPNVVVERRGLFLNARALSWDSNEVTEKYGSIKSMTWHKNTG